MPTKRKQTLFVLLTAFVLLSCFIPLIDAQAMKRTRNLSVYKTYKRAKASTVNSLPTSDLLQLPGDGIKLIGQYATQGLDPKTKLAILRVLQIPDQFSSQHKTPITRYVFDGSLVNRTKINQSGKTTATCSR